MVGKYSKFSAAHPSYNGISAESMAQTIGGELYGVVALYVHVFLVYRTQIIRVRIGYNELVILVRIFPEKLFTSNVKAFPVIYSCELICL